jgi:S1-C subfamily serine protease
MGDNTEMGTLAVTEEVHAKQQEAARKEAERAARKAPQDAAADAKGAGEPASKKGFGRPERRPPGRAAERAGLKPGDLMTELDGTPVRDDIRFATIFHGGGRPTTSDRPPPRCSSQ